jgi:hypothetical protein
MLRLVAIGEMKPGNIQTLAQQGLDYLHRPASGADCADDFGHPFVRFQFHDPV